MAAFDIEAVVGGGDHEMVKVFFNFELQGLEHMFDFGLAGIDAGDAGDFGGGQPDRLDFGRIGVVIDDALPDGPSGVATHEFGRSSGAK